MYTGTYAKCTPKDVVICRLVASRTRYVGPLKERTFHTCGGTRLSTSTKGVRVTVFYNTVLIDPGLVHLAEVVVILLPAVRAHYEMCPIEPARVGEDVGT